RGVGPGLGGGPVDRGGDQLVRLRGIEASVACGNGQRGQGGGGENGVGGVRVEAAQACGQSVVEGAEVAASVEGAEEGHLVGSGGPPPRPPPPAGGGGGSAGLGAGRPPPPPGVGGGAPAASSRGACPGPLAPPGGRGG